MGKSTFKRTYPCPKICGQSRRCFCVRNESQLPSKSENASDSKELADIPVKEVMEELGIRNVTQVIFRYTSFLHILRWLLAI